MFIAKWNKSVILTYIGMFFSITGMIICLTTGNLKQALSCLVVSGICDMFDGYVARKCKRNKEEIEFGIQLDSLVDTLSFVAFPIIIMIKMGLTKWYHLIPLTMFGIGGIARLAHFNITTNDDGKPVPFYTGLPVTAIAMTLPLLYLILLIKMPELLYMTILTIFPALIAFLNIVKIHVPKPHGIAYAVFAIAAIIVLVLFLGIL